MIYFILGFAILIICILGYAVYNLMRKVEVYETALATYYTNTSNILRTARELDSMQMFEKDDDVGILFQRLIATIGDLREVVYEDIYGNEKRETQ